MGSGEAIYKTSSSGVAPISSPSKTIEGEGMLNGLVVLDSDTLLVSYAAKGQISLGISVVAYRSDSTQRKMQLTTKICYFKGQKSKRLCDDFRHLYSLSHTVW
jgi:hypothetical protein